MSSYLIPIAIFIVSIAVLSLSSDWFIDCLKKVSSSFSVHPFVLAFVFSAIGTSLPEIFGTSAAALQGHDALATSDIIGSNIINITLILGLSGTLSAVSFQRSDVTRRFPIYVISLIFCLYFVARQSLPRWAGAVLVLSGVALIIFSLLQARTSSSAEKLEMELDLPESPASPSALKGVGSILLAILFLALIVVSSNYVVHSAVALARLFKVSEVVIGTTAVAIGTSLPELVTSLSSIRHHMPSYVMGLVLGSNLFNFFFGLGFPTLLAHGGSLTVGGKLGQVNAVYLVFVSALYVVIGQVSLLRAEHGKGEEGLIFSRVGSALLFVCFVAYIPLLIYGHHIMH